MLLMGQRGPRDGNKLMGQWLLGPHFPATPLLKLARDIHTPC